MFAGRFFLSLLIAPVALFAQPRSGKDSVLVKFGFENELSLGAPSFLIDSSNTKSFSQVLPLVDGLSYKKIAEKYCISISTIRTHICNIYTKLHVHSKSAAVAKILGRPNPSNPPDQSGRS